MSGEDQGVSPNRSTSRPSLPRKKKANPTPFIVGSAVVVIVLLGIAIVGSGVLNSGSQPDAKKAPRTSSKDNASVSPKNASVSSKKEHVERSIVGTWKRKDGGTYVFHQDGRAEYNGGIHLKGKWICQDTGARKYSVSWENGTNPAAVTSDDGLTMS